MARIEANREAVSGLRLLLKHTAIQYAVAASIVIAALFGGLYLIKDSALMDAFKRDDNALSALAEGQKSLAVKLDALAADNETTHRDIAEIKASTRELQKMVIISIVFNPNVPVDKRAAAFEMAKELKINHDIRRQYREFVMQYPDAIWSTGGGKNTRIVTNDYGISYEQYE